MFSGSDVVDLVCSQRDQIPLLLAVMVTMGLLVAFSFLFVSPGDDSFPLLVFDAVLVVGSFVVFAVTYRYCAKRAMDE